MRFAGAMMGAMMVTAPAMAATVKDGVDAWQRGDYSGAVAIWRPQADAGDADAAFNLAQAYKLGRGVSADLGQAKMWYGKSAQAGHIQGAANYGLLLFQDGDRRSAMPWITKAADAGDPRAQYVLGTALFNGDLATKDWPKAYALMTRAAAAGLPQATTSLSQMDQYMSPTDRQNGLQLASQMAARPIPPTGRQLVTGGGADTGLTAPASVVSTRPSDLASPSPVRVAQAKPAKVPPAAKAPPAAKPAPVPRSAAATPALASSGGKWMIQLGAYGSQEGAATAWGKIAGRLGGLHPIYEKAGAVTRLRAGPLADKAAAAKACASAGQACFPVAP
ncbi:SPOR domain-containing protein [Sphingomonas abietis]|uniref:SPOR domain-containing protein n=1 Tax=Sphingomonas abietis TaxID=3012344 RepID=A0ABY7NTE2_9SPHN|nr:SPOR domain-containing protein [Sphingomonas abietis]WBO24075.1 SPOR domain-containing protein [Sphingomonas abietis]